MTIKEEAMLASARAELYKQERFLLREERRLNPPASVIKMNRIPRKPVVCPICGEAKSVEEFAKGKSKGVQAYLACRSCRKSEKEALQAQAIKTGKGSLRDELINRLGGKCKRCSYDEFREALEFHHRDRAEKQGHIAKMIERAATRGYPSDWEALEAEILKCDLLCSNCHQAYHKGCWE